MAENITGKRTDYTGVMIGAILVPVILLFIHLGRENLGRSVCVSLAGIMVAIRIRWDLRRHDWFWGIVVTLLALHVPLFFLVQWPHGWIPAIAMLPIALGDCLVFLGAVRLVERFIQRATPPHRR